MDLRAHRSLAGDSAPHVGAGIEERRGAEAARLVQIFPHDPLDMRLDVCEAVVRDVRDLVVDAVLLEHQALAREEHVGMSGGGQVGDAVADEDDEGDGAVVALQLGVAAGVGHGARLVVAEVAAVDPKGLPLGTVAADLGVVGDDVDAGGGILAEVAVKDAAQYGLQAGGDDVERNIVLAAELVEALKGRVELELGPHDLEAVFERDAERGVHLLGHLTKRALS